MLASWHQKLTRADSAGAQPLSQGARTRAALAVSRGLYAIVIPAVFWLAVIPGHTTAGMVAANAAEIYFVFWLVAAVVILAWRRGRTGSS